MATKRRDANQTAQAVAAVDRLIEGGRTTAEALKSAGVASSVYQRHKRGLKRKSGESGEVKISAIPPRPKKGGKRVPKPVNLHDVGSLAHRISVLDRKIKALDFFQRERSRLATALMNLLKG